MLKTDELRNLTKAELEEKLVALKKELFELRGQAKVGKLEKTSRIRLVRRDIARLGTILNEDLPPQDKKVSEGIKDEERKK